MLEMECLYPLMPKSKAYYLLYQLPMSFILGVVLSMLDACITNKHLLAMWQIENLEWKEYLTRCKAI